MPIKKYRKTKDQKPKNHILRCAVTREEYEYLYKLSVETQEPVAHFIRDGLRKAGYLPSNDINVSTKGDSR